MKNKAGLLAFMAMAASVSDTNLITGEPITKKKIVPKKPKIIPKGCHKFTFPGFTCIALNEKSAFRKYHNHLKSK